MALFVSSLPIHLALAEAPGSATYGGLCVACHTIGGGRLVGPDLAGVSERRSEQWLVDFITSSQTMIQSGDPDAVALFEEYNGMVMPDALVAESEVLAVIGYINSQTPGTDEPQAVPEAAVEVVAEAEVASPEAILLGSHLFQGTVRLTNGGPTCIACHDVTHDAVIGGGILAAELTDVFSRMSAAGIEAILGRPPFPVMQAAYHEKPLTEDEISALVAFLQSVDEDELTRQPRDYGLGLFGSGVVGSAVIYGICGLVWRGRKKASVHQDIFDRQVKSS
jgi:mono/diheme cytochrome c family protein